MWAPQRSVPVTLLVDRDADTRVMYAEYLRLSGYDVVEASDGREALAKALSTHPDVVIMETRLPGISGFDLCDLLHHDPATRATPILVVTADAYPRDIARARQAGADTVLVKPCLPQQVLDEIRRLLQQSRELRQRSDAIRGRAASELERGQRALQKVDALQRRSTLSRAHRREVTTEPPMAPPSLICPDCDLPLLYQRSHLGGVSARHPEQWDYYECAAGCGTFQYRQRTRKLRRV